MSRRWIFVAGLAAFAGVLAAVAFRKGARRTLKTDWPVTFAHRGASYPYRGRDLRVPTLEEIFHEFPDAAVNVEIKEVGPGIERAVLSVIEEAGAEGRTLVASGKHEVIERFRRVAGREIPTAASRRE